MKTIIVLFLLVIAASAQITIESGRTQFQTNAVVLPDLLFTNNNAFDVHAAIFDRNTTNLEVMVTNRQVSVAPIGSQIQQSNTVSVIRPGFVSRTIIPANSAGVFPSHRFKSGVVITNDGELSGGLLQ